MPNICEYSHGLAGLISLWNVLLLSLRHCNTCLKVFFFFLSIFPKRGYPSAFFRLPFPSILQGQIILHCTDGLFYLRVLPPVGARQRPRFSWRDEAAADGGEQTSQGSVLTAL